MYRGDYREDGTVDFTFTTNDSSGAPATLGGTPAVSVYKANGTAQSTAGVTLTVDFDAVTGLNHVRIDLSSGAFYAVDEDYSVVITTGTVDGTSVVGYTLATFSIENRRGESIFDRLGAPAGASIAADLATVDGIVDDILVDTADMQPKLGTPAGADMSADIASIQTDTTAILVDTGTTIPATLGTPVGANLSADIAGVPAALLDLSNGVETGLTPRQALRLMAAVLYGKVSGGGTGTNTFRDINDSKNRVVSTVDASGNRSAVVLDAT